MVPFLRHMALTGRLDLLGRRLSYQKTVDPTVVHNQLATGNLLLRNRNNNRHCPLALRKRYPKVKKNEKEKREELPLSPRSLMLRIRLQELS